MERCRVQKEALSAWWKLAIQSYVQQRMWMQLGHVPSECLLPSRFERLYTPGTLSRFDELLARNWAVPLRMSHSAQRSQTDDDSKLLMSYRKSFKVKSGHSLVESTENDDSSIHSDVENDKSIDDIGIDQNPSSSKSGSEYVAFSSLKDFVKSHGFKSTIKPRLGHFLKPYQKNQKADTDEKDIPTTGERFYNDLFFAGFNPLTSSN